MAKTTDTFLFLRQQKSIVWESDAQTALEIFRFQSNSSIDDVTWISADVFETSSPDETIKIRQLGREEYLKRFKHKVMKGMNQSTESTSYSHHIARRVFYPLERGRWSTGQLRPGQIHQGDAQWNQVHQLLQPFSYFLFDRFG